MSDHRIPSGFTLIETLLYVACLSLILGGALGAAYEIIQNSDRLSRQVAITEETNFLERKMMWALMGSSILSPAPSKKGTTLSVNRTGFSHNPIVFDLGDSAIRIKTGANPPVALTSASVILSSISFEHLVSPEGVRIMFFVDGTPSVLTTYLQK